MPAALPFWISLTLIPVAWTGAVWGGVWVFAMILWVWLAIGIIDHAAGDDSANADPATPKSRLKWHRAITLIWFPVQFATVYGLLWHVTRGDLVLWEKIALFYSLGAMTGTVGITYAHELIHQPGRIDRWLGDFLLAMTLYSHFRSDHLLVHHRYVGTPRDVVTARYGEGFWRFYLRVLRQGPRSAWRAEAALLARRGVPLWHRSNPFWRYGALQAGMLGLAAAVGGWQGVGLFTLQAALAIYHLEIVNYVEHYGLTRERLPNGSFEPVKPHHSWNTSHRVSNWLLINLQRHSDHHYKPARPYPLLQDYAEDTAPRLPYGYPAMTMIANSPTAWRRLMDPKVRAWRRQFYPHISDWSAYG